MTGGLRGDPLFSVCDVVHEDVLAQPVGSAVEGPSPVDAGKLCLYSDILEYKQLTA